MNAQLHPSSSVVNYERALKNLRRSLATPIAEPRDLSGVIKDFEMTYELSWKVLKKILLDQGVQTQGAKDVYTQAYRLNLIAHESVWLSMIRDRNQSAHVYEEKEAAEIAERIRTHYLPLFESLLKSQR